MDDWLGLLSLLLTGFLPGAIIGAILGYFVKKLLPKIWNWLAALALAVAIYFAAMPLVWRTATWLVESEPANREADGPLLFVAIGLGAVLIDFALATGCFVGAWAAMRRTTRK